MNNSLKKTTYTETNDNGVTTETTWDDWKLLCDEKGWRLEAKVTKKYAV